MRDSQSFAPFCLSLDDVAIQRGDKRLLEGLSLSWHGGQFVQVEGHNGIGKTSLLRVVAGLARPVRGKVCWQDEAIVKIRETYYENLLFLGHQSGVKPELTPWENLRFYQKVAGEKRCLQGSDVLWQVLDTVGLFGKEDLPASQLSAGQQKRIALARLWLSKDAVWILDEPFNAIDKQGVANLTALFEQHVARGGLVILTSHQVVPSERLSVLQLGDFKAKDEGAWE